MDARQKKAMAKRFKHFVNPTTMKMKDSTRMRTASSRGYKKTEKTFNGIRKNSQMKMKVQKSKYQMIGAEARNDSIKFGYRA